MNATPPPDPASPTPSLENDPPPAGSLGGRLFNVIAAPGEAFDEVRSAPYRASNWLVPALLTIVVGWLGVWLIYSQPAMRHQQDEAGLRVIQRLVEKGKIPKEKAEELQAQSGGGGYWKYALGPTVGVVAVAFAAPFWNGFLIWLIGSKIHKGGFPYVKALEVAGLTAMIGLLAGVVKTLLILALGSLHAAPGPILLLKEFDPFNASHMALAMVDIFGLWAVGVRALSMARLGNLGLGLCLAWFLALWAAFNGVVLALVVGIRALLGF